jgi:hypothetical protein
LRCSTRANKLVPGIKTRDQTAQLFEAVINHDRPQIKQLLAKIPALASARAPKPVLSRRIAHWIYAGDTPLHAAAAGHYPEIIKLLLAAGADVNAAGTHRLATPLHYAADGYSLNPAWKPAQQTATIRLLHHSGADLEARDKNGATPLHRAVRTRCAAAVQQLLELGSDPTAQNNSGSTPFHLAVQNTGRGGSGTDEAKTAQRQIIQAFLDRNISPNLKDHNGKSVLDWARTDWIRALIS